MARAKGLKTEEQSDRSDLGRTPEPKTVHQFALRMNPRGFFCTRGTCGAQMNSAKALADCRGK